MPASDDMLMVYRDLADYHERQGLDQLRDRFLVLAAAAAQAAGQGDEAERLRQRLLCVNAQHVLRSFTSMAQALTSPAVQTYVENLRQEYPLHAAEDLLASVRGPAVPPPQRKQSRMLPPTAPLIDLDGPADQLKVYPARDEPDVPILPSWQEPPRKTSFPSPRPSRLLSPAARPSTVVVKRPTIVEPPARPARPAIRESEDVEESGGKWVGLSLFVIVAAAALYLAWITLLGPFLS